MKSHPAAEAYRLMTDEELADLTADITRNGLIDAIITTEYEGKDVIVDGRNREQACKLAGVEPRYEKMNGIDAAAFVAARGNRRNISKGQQAIALAMLYPEPEKAGRKKKDANNDKETLQFSRMRLSQARQILAHSRDMAIAIRDGSIKFDEALNKIASEKRLLETSETKTERLRSEAPDLADIVDEERMKLDEAIAALDERKRRLKEIVESANHSADRIFGDLQGHVANIMMGVEAGDTELLGKIDAKKLRELITQLERRK